MNKAKIDEMYEKDETLKESLLGLYNNIQRLKRNATKRKSFWHRLKGAIHGFRK